MASSGNDATVSFKKLSNFGRRNVGRRRDKSSSSDSDGDNDVSAAAMKLKKDGRRKNALFQSTSSKKRKTDGGGSSSESEESSDGAAYSSAKVSYKASGTSEMVGPRDLGATATLEIDTEQDRDETAVRKRAIELNKELKGL